MVTDPLTGRFEVVVYDRDFLRKGWIKAFSSFRATPRHNGIGTAEFVISPSSPQVGNLLTDGARVVVKLNGEFLMSGPVTMKSGTFPLSRSLLTFQVEDDFRELSAILGFANPAEVITETGPLTAQGSEEAFDVREGPAETVVKGFVTANGVTRLGKPITVATDLERGDDVKVQMRMQYLADQLLPVVDQAGIGITVRQSGAGLVLDCYEPTVRAMPLTERSGVLAGGSWSTTAPTATRAIVGDQGTGLARQYVAVVDEAREALWGITETYVDAADTDDLLDLYDRGAVALAEAGLGAGFSFELAQTQTFRYGRTVKVGDIVTVQPIPGVTITDVLREVTISHTLERFSVQSTVGAAGESWQDIASRAIASLARALHNIKSGV